MKARILANSLKIGGLAWEYIKEIENSRHIPAKETDAPKKAGALEILESFQENDRDSNDIELGIMDGEYLNRRLEYGLKEFKVIPCFKEGDSAYLLGDDRLFDVVHISYESESVQLRDDKDEFVVPWHLVVPSK
jgi:hypothetical protein